MAGEKTEAPTPRKLKQAKDKGQVSQSQDLVTAGVTLLSVFVLKQIGPSTWRQFEEIMRGGLANKHDGELTISSVMLLFQEFAMLILKAGMPLAGIIVLSAVALSAGQTGLVFSRQALTPQFKRLNPLSGFKRLLFSKQSAMNLAKSLAKMGAVSVVVWMTLTDQMAQLTALGERSIPAAAMVLADLSFDIALRCALCLFILGLADFAWQRRQFLSQLKMTKDELKQEMKESDGDPHIKAAIRRRRQQMLSRMMSAVPTADVVVTNPTHYAVAIKYDPLSMGAPIIVAKGERLLALRIKEVAKKNGVPILEEPPLARALYASVEIGHPVPANLYRAVAEVLAWVYALRDKRPFKWVPSGA